jgi:RecA/RadA recombinase
MSKQEGVENENMRKPLRYDSWDGDMFTLQDLMDSEFPEPSWLVEPYIPKGSITGVIGKPGDGKSMFLRMLAASVLLKKQEFLNCPLNSVEGKVVFFTAEDTDARTKAYFLHQMEALSETVKREDIADNITFIFKGWHTPEEILDRVRTTARQVIPDLIVIDNLGGIFAGSDPNNTAMVRKAIEPYVQIAKEQNCAIVFIHHLRKSAYSLRPDQEHAQGASGFGQIVRSMIDIRRDVYDPATRYLTLVKGNYSPDEALFKSRVLTFDSGKLIFTFSGRIIAAEEIPLKEDSLSYFDIPWEEIFDNRSELTRKEILARSAEYGISRATIDRQLKKLNKLSRGQYSLPDNFSISHSHCTQDETNSKEYSNEE